MNSTLRTTVTFAGSLVAGCLAAVAIASTAAVSAQAPTLRPAAPVRSIDVVRLDPVVVTVSKTYFDAVRQDAGTDVARAADARKVTRG